MMKIDIFELFEQADDELLSALSQSCEPLDSDADKRIFARIQEKCRVSFAAPDEGYEDVVEGVDIYMKKPWKKVLAIAATLVLLVGGAAGGAALINTVNRHSPTSRIEEETKVTVFANYRKSDYEKGMLYHTSGLYGSTVEYFLDYETMKETPICAMPNCTHTNSSCLATQMGVNPVIYNDYIYYFKSSYNYKDVTEGHQFYMNCKLYKASLDTSETQVVAEFTDCIPDDWNSDFVLIGSTLWFVGDDKNMKGDDYSREMHYIPSSETPGAHFMCSIDLDTGKYTNHGEICEEYRTSEYWEQCNGAHIKGVYKGKIQISLQYEITDGTMDIENREEWEEKRRTQDPDERVSFSTYEYDTKTGECVKTDRRFAIDATEDTFVGCDFNAGDNVLYVTHNGEEHVFEDSANVFILGDKLFMCDNENKWIDMNDWSEHELPDEIGEFVLQVGQYKDSYIILNEQYQAFKYTEEELRAQ
ncbi:MAG: hypothetical protein IKW87_01235 [Ruminococcus sp.]|nr:hypothetical protein [Ruminococcus sp.]